MLRLFGAMSQFIDRQCASPAYSGLWDDAFFLLPMKPLNNSIGEVLNDGPLRMPVFIDESVLVSNDITVEGWWSRVDGKQAVALSMKEDRQHAREAWVATGFAVEFALKAVIMRRKGLNHWPDRTPENSAYYSHNLRQLLKLAGIERKDIPPRLLPRFRTLFDWDRSHDYVHGRMPRRIARQMYDAAFDPVDGVVTWLKGL